jgi:ribosomal protein S18 acetylase RimI-like enzyme
MPDTDPETVLRPATVADADAVTRCVTAAYRHYCERLGRMPAPMLQDYREVIARNEVFVALADRLVCGVLVLGRTEEGFLLDNVAVSPAAQGSGIGRMLLQLAEQRACAAGYDSIFLYTHERMLESRALYARIGYEEFARRTEQGCTRVYLRKRLALL